MKDGLLIPSSSDNVCLFDLDGTLADYSRHVAQNLAIVMGLERQIIDPRSIASENWTEDHRIAYDDMRSDPTRRSSMPKLDRGFQVLEIVKELGLNREILSKLPKNPKLHTPAMVGKASWINQHLGSDTAYTLTTTYKHKHYGRLLVDDLWEGNVEYWLGVRPRGLAIIAPNSQIKHDRALVFDGNLDHIRQRIIEAMSIPYER